MTNEQYILRNREADIRTLALKKTPEGVDPLWCLRQIEGYQLAKKKLPEWAATDGLWFPPRLSMEQCSSESTARYKQETVQRLMQGQEPGVFVDLTGGFGVDFSYMARGFRTAVYVERQEELCRTADHNMRLLGLDNVTTVNADSTAYVGNLDRADIIYADPARRNTAGRKTVAIEDCTPDIGALQHKILAKSRYAIIKLSPMLDITQALRTLTNVREIHVVSVKGECKELLCVLSASNDTAATTCHCVNLGTTDKPFSCVYGSNTAVSILSPDTPLAGKLLFEPNASILKAGVQDAFAAEYRLSKLHPMSNLYVSDTESQAEDLSVRPPARIFRIMETGDFSKSSLKTLLHGCGKGNITIRNFPSTVAELRKRLRLKEGGDDYFFATTMQSGRHVLIKCKTFINGKNINA